MKIYEFLNLRMWLFSNFCFFKKSIFNTAKIILTDKNLIFYYLPNRIPYKNLQRKCRRIIPNIKGTDQHPYPLSSVGINTPSGSVLRLSQIQIMRFQNKIWIVFWKKKISLEPPEKDCIIWAKSTTIIFREEDGIIFPVASLRWCI